MSETLLDPTCVLLWGAPEANNLLEQVGGWCVLWRVSEGEPPDGAIEPAKAWDRCRSWRLPDEAVV